MIDYCQQHSPNYGINLQRYNLQQKNRSQLPVEFPYCRQNEALTSREEQEQVGGGKEMIFVRVSP